MLKYKLVGTGPHKVIAAHSWLADHQTYTPMIPYLDLDTFTYAFPDFRGYGKSRDIEGKFSVHEMASDLLEVASGLKWDQFSLVGNSMGGQAVQWITGQPDNAKRVRSAVLLCSVPASGFPLDENGSAFFTSAIDDVAARGQCASAVTGGRLGDAFANYMADLSASTATAGAIRGYLRAWTEDDVSAEIGSGSRNVHIYVGQYDPVLTRELALEKISPLFSSTTVHTIDGAGHYPSMETPAFTGALLNSILLGGI